MEKAEDILLNILKAEHTRVRSSYPSKDVVFVIIEIIRALDYMTFMLKHDIEVKDQEILLSKYKMGWSLAFSIFYADLDLHKDLPLFKFDASTREWLDSIIQHCGSLQSAQQILDYSKAELAKISTNDNFNFDAQLLVEAPGHEYFEILSLLYYHSVIGKVLEPKSKPITERLPAIRTKLESIVNIFHKDFINYTASEEIDLFYSQFGYHYMMTSQIIDEFADGDLFNGICYKEYIDFAEELFATALMHRDCCMALANKTSHKIHLRNILTYCFSKEAFLSSLVKFRKWDKEKVSNILDCFTLNKINFNDHLNYPGVSPAPFIEIGTDTLIRSDYGCMNNTIFFLNRELKRKFPADYFVAVNNRETRFKKQLYDLFPQDNIIKIIQNINIKTFKGDTDIDAILFDKKRNILGLFQLKWQDSFSSSMRERYSRISNFIPKSVEWIDKVENWLQSHEAKDILKKLNIESRSNEFETVHLFVLARNHAHFTNTEFDKRAVWGSWFQLLEASGKVKDPFSINPIGELAAKLNFFTPEMRKQTEKIPVTADTYFKFSKYKISVKVKF